MINATLLYGRGGNDVTRDEDHVGAKGSIYARQKYKKNPSNIITDSAKEKDRIKYFSYFWMAQKNRGGTLPD
jgi:hypothetical protein